MKNLNIESRNRGQKSKLNIQIVEWLIRTAESGWRIAESKTIQHPGVFSLWAG
jgi:hypothetical protein